MHFNGSANTTSGIRISSGSVLSAGEAPRRNPTYDPIGGLPKSRGGLQTPSARLLTDTSEKLIHE